VDVLDCSALVKPYQLSGLSGVERRSSKKNIGPTSDHRAQDGAWFVVERNGTQVMGRFSNFDQVIFPMLALVVVLGVVVWLIGGGRHGSGAGRRLPKGMKAEGEPGRDPALRGARKLLKAERAGGGRKGEGKGSRSGR
jgi:hypothetical protein